MKEKKITITIDKPIEKDVRNDKDKEKTLKIGGGRFEKINAEKNG